MKTLCKVLPFALLFAAGCVHHDHHNQPPRRSPMTVPHGPVVLPDRKPPHHQSPPNGTFRVPKRQYKAPEPSYKPPQNAPGHRPKQEPDNVQIKPFAPGATPKK